MNWFWDSNLIHCLDVYLLLVFVAGTCFRVFQYRAFLGLIWSMHDRWPHVVQLARQHRGIFVTWGTILPALLALFLWLGHMLACRLVWPEADITLAQLVHVWLAALVAGALGAAMILFDCYSAWRIKEWDRTQAEEQFDQAEHWLKSWTAPAVRFFTLGFINPRKLVGVEVHKALVKASGRLNTALWWSSIAVSLRIAFGGSIWLTYVYEHY